MKKTFLFLLCCFMIILNGKSISTQTNQETFFNREHYKKAAEEFKYKDPIAVEKNTKKNPTKINWGWLKYVSYIIVIAALVFLIYRLILYLYAPDNRKLKSSQIQLQETEDEPTIESDLESLLEIALKEHNFREAIRIHYLLAIRKLNENKIVVYTIDKTNFEYVSEVGGHPVFPVFRDLTLTFERIWFGDAIANEDRLIQYQKKFTAFTEVISSNRSKQAAI